MSFTTTPLRPLYSSPLSPSSSPLRKKKKMSVTQTYYLAHTARGKLSHEAARPDHNLRLLVGHANLLDSLMVELAEAEQEQETWFNQSVKRASSRPEEPRHVQWVDTVVEDPEEDWQADDAESSDSDSDSDFDSDVEMEAASLSVRRVPAQFVQSREYVDDEDFEDDGEEDYASLSLHKTHSHSRSSNPPELDHDSDSSEDESMPPSPPQDMVPTFSETQRKKMATTDFFAADKAQAPISAASKSALFEDGYYIPPRTPVTAVSVY